MSKAELLNEMQNGEYDMAIKPLQKLLEEYELNISDIKQIMTTGNKLVVGDFLQYYNGFSDDELAYLERFIIENLDHEDRMFVSDLIEFATDYNFNLPYQKVIDFIKIKEHETHDDLVGFACIDYIHSNFKISYIDEIAPVLEAILNDPKYEQSAQVRAAFTLFRFTYKKNYLADLIDLIVNGQSNEKLLSNILKDKFNQAQYFEYYEVLNGLLPGELRNKEE